MSVPPTFKFKSAYMGCVQYHVHDDDGAHTIDHQETISDYQRNIYNGGPAEFARDVEARLNCISRHCENWNPLRPETIAAFNTWRLAEWERTEAHFANNVERYGVIPEDDPLRRKPIPVEGVHYESGWVKNVWRDPISAAEAVARSEATKIAAAKAAA